MEVIAYYLGQYSPNEFNDDFWGAGFTEWHNVARARPLFPGHVQPVLPGEFGFYDLRLSEVIDQQINYAREIGVTAFCYWHYWFSGRRLLNGPLDTAISLNNPRHKFMLGWANESWSGVWHGETNRILLEQTYSKEEMLLHAQVLNDYMDSGQYLKVEDEFPFLIYKPRLIPDAVNYVSALRDVMLQRYGKKLYLIGNWTPGRRGEIKDPKDYGLDSLVITPVAKYFRSSVIQNGYSALWQILRSLGIGPEIRSYKSVDDSQRLAKQDIKGISHHTIVTGWDNSPRSGRRALVLRGFNEASFMSAARSAYGCEMENVRKLLFVKSWNEWAEGNVVEPRYKETWSIGRALKRAISNESNG